MEPAADQLELVETSLIRQQSCNFTFTVTVMGTKVHKFFAIRPYRLKYAHPQLGRQLIDEVDRQLIDEALSASRSRAPAWHLELLLNLQAGQASAADNTP